jgi:hypothetical protein
MAQATGSKLGPYEVVELLGAGGMGEVYRARDPRLGRDVAIKVLPEEVAADAQRLAFFEREARAVAALNHPNILTVHDVGTHDGAPYVVTELLEGENLRELVSRRSPTVKQVLGDLILPAPCIGGSGPQTSHRDPRCHPPWAVAGPPGSRAKCFHACSVSPTAPDPDVPRHRSTSGVAFGLRNSLGARKSNSISQLNNRPACAPANASVTPSRTPPHGSGSSWVARPLGSPFL